jgi:hypothetical protein
MIRRCPGAGTSRHGPFDGAAMTGLGFAILLAVDIVWLWGIIRLGG